MNPHAPKWWLNRKSRLGLKPIAKEPPSSPGKPWWTTPPTIELPDLDHIEYAVQFQAEVCARAATGDRKAQALAVAIAPWVRNARRLLHEQQCKLVPELGTVDGTIIAANKLMKALATEATHGGYRITPHEQRVIDALEGIANAKQRERGLRYGRRQQ